MAAPQNQSLIGNVLAQTQSHTWTRWSGRGLRCRSFLTFTGMFQHPVRSSHGVSSDQLLSHVRLFVIPWTAARQASLSFTISQSLLKLVSIESMMPSNHLILCSPLLLLPSVFPSVRVFSNESVLCSIWCQVAPNRGKSQCRLQCYTAVVSLGRHKRGLYVYLMCVYVCVRERDRERERSSHSPLLTWW